MPQPPRPAPARPTGGPRAAQRGSALGLWLAGALLAAAAIVACGTLPPRHAVPAATPAAPLGGAASTAAPVLSVQDRGGPVPPAAAARELARVQAEGRGDRMEHHLRVLAAHDDAPLWRGNRARLLVDGPATFAAMRSAIAAARHRVLLEFYIVEAEGIAAEVAALLLRKAAEGVGVALLYDSIGSLGTDARFFERLREGGVAVCAFNPVNPLARPGRWQPTERNHRKMLAVDSEAAFVGGINLSDVYAEGSGGSAGSGGARGSAGRPDDSPPPDRGWRDTQVELRGPVVVAMATLFRTTWARQGCPDTPALGPAPPPRHDGAAGARLVRVVAAEPAGGLNPTYTLLMDAVAAARHSVHLTMAYFAPGPELVDALSQAARRGVRVVLVLPGHSDVPLALHAARAWYAQLLAAGVQVHEMRHAVMHAKTAVIDGVLSTVGSSNLDWRSIVGNHELDVIVLGDDFGREMEALFARDVAASRRIDAAAWARRGPVQRLLEGLGRLAEPWL